MNKRKFDAVLYKLEYQMRKAESEGDAIMVAHYAQLIEDLLDVSDDPPQLHRNTSPYDGLK